MLLKSAAAFDRFHRHAARIAQKDWRFLYSRVPQESEADEKESILLCEREPRSKAIERSFANDVEMPFCRTSSHLHMQAMAKCHIGSDRPLSALRLHVTFVIRNSTRSVGLMRLDEWHGQLEVWLALSARLARDLGE